MSVVEVASKLVIRIHVDRLLCRWWVWTLGYIYGSIILYK